MDNATEEADLRVQRSQASIQRALFELTVEKGYAAVTVRDIALRAGVNRSTFYRHYLDKDDLLEHYLDRLQGQVTAAAAQAAGEGDTPPERVPAGLLLLVRHVQEHAAFYRVMLGKHGNQAFSHRFRQLSEQRYRHLLARSDSAPDLRGPPVDLQLQYISAAFVGAILWWLEHNFPCAAEQFALWLGQLSMMSAGLALPQLKQPAP